MVPPCAACRGPRISSAPRRKRWRSSKLDDPIRTLLDRAAIQEVLVRYATSLDDKDWGRLAGCFTEDGVADYGAGVFEGRAAIVGLCRSMLGPLLVSQHLLGTFEIEVAGDAAKSRCYFHAQHVKPGLAAGEQLIVAGTYEDELVRTATGWLIRHRKLIASWRSGNPEVLEPA